MTTIELDIQAADIDEAVKAFIADTPLDTACPIAIVAQRQLERRVRVFTDSWHLAARERVPATRGDRLPADALAFIGRYDSWAHAIRTAVTYQRVELEEAIAGTADRPGSIHLSLTVPERLIEPTKKKAEA